MLVRRGRLEALGLLPGLVSRVARGPVLRSGRRFWLRGSGAGLAGWVPRTWICPMCLTSGPRSR